MQGKKILYVSNRVALDYQQKKEFYRLTYPRERVLAFDENDRWEELSEFGCITLITYHKLITKLQKECTTWYEKFDYVVLDECHFFYSDALFNAQTGNLIEKIPKVFQSCCRIYLSATPEDVIVPICYYEECENDRTRVTIYSFPRNYNNYKIHFFDGKADFKVSDKQSHEDLPGKLLQEIQRNKKDKWIVFVTGKNTGHEILEQLHEEKISAGYIDSASRKEPANNDAGSLENSSFFIWRKLLRNGKFSQQVLITTSVLDNGFSLKDSAVKNIVLFTHDRTELLQELGRCRLEEGQTVNLYLNHMSEKSFDLLNRQLDQLFGIVERYEGVARYPYSRPKVDGQPERTIIDLWQYGSKEQRQLFSINTQSGQFKFQLNQMAKWRLLKQKEYYSTLAQRVNNSTFQQESEKIKRSWFDKSLTDESYLLPTQQKQEESENKLKDFLKQYCESKTVLIEGSKEYQAFCDEFVNLYRKAYPKDRSFRQDRKNHGSKSIANHIAKLWNGMFCFCEVEKKAWSVQVDKTTEEE